MFAVTAVELASEGTANILINRYIPLWDSRATYSRTPVSSFSQSFLMPSISFLGFGKLPPVPTTQMTMWDRACKPHDGPDAGNGGQYAPKKLG